MPKPRSAGSRRTSSNKSGRSSKETRSHGASSGGRGKKGRSDERGQSRGKDSSSKSRYSSYGTEGRYEQDRSKRSAGPRQRGDAPKSDRGGERGKRYGTERGYGQDRPKRSSGPRQRTDAPKSDLGSERGKRYGTERGYGQDRPKRSSGPRQRTDAPKSDTGSERGKRYGAPRRTSGFKGRNSDDRDERRGKFTSPKTPRSGGFGRKRSVKDDQKSATDLQAPVQTEKVRLNRYIANSGVCSRREADELITMGLISVNGVTITELGYKVNPGDEVRYEQKVLRAEKPVYILLNKPKGFLTTTRDPQERKTVMNLIGEKIRERIYPVGRLDRNTTGLLLLTNDGELADKLMHPSYNVKKIYKVELDRALSQADLEKIREGVSLEEGRAMVDDVAIVSADGRTVGLEIHIGWNRVVRRIFEALGYEVMKLDRSVYAGLDKKDLPRGEWRHLSKEEIVRLKHYK